ncbi:MAG: hypothetical protein GC189_03030 [Alphaproteobacteria bacterium]|nr:hypothetical protein [Alphaproteobacteria bacterium]
MFQDYAQLTALLFAGMALGWTAMFSFVVAPVSFKDMDYGRADRHVRRVIKSGHGALALLCLVAGLGALIAGALGGAIVSGLTAAFYLMCQWTLAPRDDPRPPGARRKLKSQRILASMLTAAGMPLLVIAAILTRMGI